MRLQYVLCQMSRLIAMSYMFCLYLRCRDTALHQRLHPYSVAGLRGDQRVDKGH